MTVVTAPMPADQGFSITAAPLVSFWEHLPKQGTSSDVWRELMDAGLLANDLALNGRELKDQPDNVQKAFYRALDAAE